MSNDVVWHKNVPFGGPENKLLHFDPIFSKKTHIFHQFSTGLRKFRIREALTMGMLTCKLLLIVIAAQ